MPQKPRKQFLPSEPSKSGSRDKGGNSRRKANFRDDRQDPKPLYSTGGRKPRYSRDDEERPSREKKDFFSKSPRRKSEDGAFKTYRNQKPENNYRGDDTRPPSKPYRSAKYSENNEDSGRDRSQDRERNDEDSKPPYRPGKKKSFLPEGNERPSREKKDFTPEFPRKGKSYGEFRTGRNQGNQEKENRYEGDGEWPKPKPFLRSDGKKSFGRPFSKREDPGGFPKDKFRKTRNFARNNEVKPFREKKGFGEKLAGKKTFQKGKKKRESKPDTNALLAEPFRLNKYLAHAGIASRREADELIKSGFVTVNGQVVLEMGHKVQPGDEVRFKNQIISPEKKVYILLNKPKDFITTASDERGRPTVMDLVQNATEMRIYPVGRLDRNTTGLLLLTNDGELAQKLTHPSFEAKKVYLVSLDKPLHKEHMQQIAEGVQLEEGVAMVDAVEYADPKDRRKIGIEIHIGWNKVVRRIFEQLGYDVVQLDRVYYAGLTKDVPRGKWRRLTEKEIIMLKHFS